MSRTAQGAMQTHYPFRFSITFSFLEDADYQVIFEGECNHSLPRFYTTNVTLKYDDATQLCASRKFTGSLKDKEFLVTVENGPEICAILDGPFSGRDFAGNGMWMST